jgi:hypothetical protein
MWAMPFSLGDVHGEIAESGGEREYIELFKRNGVDVRGWLYPVAQVQE